MKRLLPTVLFAISTVAFAIDLPDGLYIHNGNSHRSYRPVKPTDDFNARPRRNSPGHFSDSEVCIRNAQVWLDAKIHKYTTGNYPAGRFEERQTDTGRIFILLNPAQAKPDLQAYTFSMTQQTDEQGRPRMYFAFNSRYTENDTIYEVHSNLWYTYQGKECPANIEEE